MITVVGTPRAGQSADAGDVTLVFDVAPAENDVVVVFGGPAVVGSSAIVGGGYTAFTADGLGGQSRSWYKVMGAVPDTQVVCDGGTDVRDAVGYVAYVLRGVDVTNVPDAVAVRADAVGSNPNPGAITTVTDGAWVFAFASIGLNDATPGALSGYTGQASANQADTFNVSVTGMYKEVAVAGLEDPPAYTGWTGSWCANTVAIRPAADAGQTIAVGQSPETDLAQIVAWAPKHRLVGQIAETDLAQAIARAKVFTFGQLLEMDLAQAMTVAKRVAVAQITEADLAQAISVAKCLLLGQVLETDLAQIITVGAGQIIVLVGQATGADLAQAIAWAPKHRLIAQAAETGEAFAVTRFLPPPPVVIGASVVNDEGFFGQQPGQAAPAVKVGVGIVAGPSPVFFGAQAGQAAPTLAGYVKKRPVLGDVTVLDSLQQQ